ncbi:hypothetical protein T484DRAFT_1766124, partial [Baffinella frigidus]
MSGGRGGGLYQAPAALDTDASQKGGDATRCESGEGDAGGGFFRETTARFGVHGCSEVAASEEAGMGLMLRATRELETREVLVLSASVEAGEVLVALPRRAILEARQGDACAFPEAFRSLNSCPFPDAFRSLAACEAFWNGARPVEKLAVALLLLNADLEREVLVLSASVEAGEVLVALPRRAILEARQGDACAFPEAFRSLNSCPFPDAFRSLAACEAFWNGARPVEKLAVALLLLNADLERQRLLGMEEYLSLLPRDHLSALS